MKGDVRFDTCKDISIKKCKKFREKSKMGINELILALTSRVLKLYFIK